MEEINWAKLQHDLIALISRRLNMIEDYFNFDTICKSWPFADTKNNSNSDLPRVSRLMLAEKEDNEGNSIRRFFSLFNGTILNKKISKANRKRCMKSMGWLITVGEDDCEVSLLHSFSYVQIELPHQYTAEDYGEHMTEPSMYLFQKTVLQEEVEEGGWGGGEG
ncbi:hypothetical protein P3S67_003031 [Capsicum chacoense]